MSGEDETMIYLFLAEGFEEVEALCPLDLLRRAGLEVKTVGVGGSQITGAHGITVCADMTDGEFCDAAPQMVILPGGMPGTLNLDASITVHHAIDAVCACGGYLAAICAAPSILGKRGLLQGRHAVCYPGFEEQLQGAQIRESRVAIDGHIITAAGMGAALEFGLALVEQFCGRETADALRHAVIAD